MQAQVIQRQYDEVIASHYDCDPKCVIGDSQGLAIRQFLRRVPDLNQQDQVRVLDLGVGTGTFLEKLREEARIQPHGLDMSQKMIDIAMTRLPDLVAAVDDAANLQAHFAEESFGLVCTHFITGFVPMAVLAPKIHAMLERGGYWSFVGGTRAGFPVLQGVARRKLLRWALGGRTLDIGNFVCNPADENEVVRTLRRHGFAVCECEVFRPSLAFKDLNDFLEFAYLGGWLTPMIEALGLHRVGPVLRGVMNTWVFPVLDHHHIVIALAKKP
jgi:SAM-dependent methyltransferase